jgi:hypothetical protein
MRHEPATRVETTRPEPLEGRSEAGNVPGRPLRHRVHEEGLTCVISNPAICNLAIAGNDWCVSDVGVSAYALEILIGVVGCARRWRTMLWLVVAFDIMIAPLGVVSIVFIIIQPIVSGTWYSLWLTELNSAAFNG